MSKNANLIVRLIIMAIAATSTFGMSETVNAPFYVLFLLLFALNTQLRVTILTGNLFLLSLFIDIALVAILYQGGTGLNHMLLVISVIDGLLYFEVEGYLFSGINLAFLAYFLQDEPISMLLMALLVYSSLIPLILQIRDYQKRTIQTENLYDENRRYSYQLERSKQRLEEYSKKVEQLSQEEERSRISVEIHDTVGHKLTGNLMQLEAALLMLTRDFQQGIKTVEAVRDNLRESIDILRKTVKEMKPKQGVDRLSALGDLMKDFQQSTGIDITFQVKGKPENLYPSAELTLYKNAREALTNAARHGRATSIGLILEYGVTEVSLTVLDNGLGCHQLHKGMGISGMEERAKMLGGRLELASQNGFAVKTVLPVR